LRCSCRTGRDAQPRAVERSRIEGGTTGTFAPGDVNLIPIRVPHWFGITGERLILPGTKLPGGK
jgi:hypothetical protein